MMHLPTNATPKVEQSGRVKIITFTGSRVRADLENVIAAELAGQTAGADDGHLLLDFTHVETISSIELATLINLQKRLKTAGTRLTLFNLSPNVFEVFSITRLSNYFGICREEAGEPRHVESAQVAGNACQKESS